LTFKLKDSQIAEIDTFVKRGTFFTRSEAIRVALNLGIKELKKKDL
jgi:Arc/MetJ-type ribon-helix-helix transcriptional regulator